MPQVSRVILLLLTLLALPAAAEDVIEETTVKDPLETVNRAIFSFNDGLDTYFLRPVASGYRFITPDFAERGIGNFFANLFDANSAFNALLQGRFASAARGGGRFLVNSTFGVLGFFDIASRMDFLYPYRTDFGHTLAIWGVPDGPYLMVPVLGPRTMRSGTGSIVDAYTSPQAFIDNVRLRNSLYGLELVDSRASLLDADELLSGDRYIFVRDAYLQQRRVLVNDGEVDDSFSDFGVDGAWEEEF